MAQGRTFEDGPKARELFDAGWSCNAIARELGVSPSTISAWAKREGLRFDRTQVDEANSARAVDASASRFDRAAARARIIDRLYQRVEKIQDRLDKPYRHRVPTETGSMLVTDDDPPARDEASLSSAISNYLGEARKLEMQDDDNGLTPMESMLGRLAQRFGLTYSDTIDDD